MRTDRKDKHGYPVFVCPLCNCDHEGFMARRTNPAKYGVDPEIPAVFVCSNCASIVSNLDHLAHTGDPLSWPRDPRPEVYKKTTIPEALRWQVFERDGMKCKHCGDQKWLRADHVIPERFGGPTTADNLQTLCRSCNSKKGLKVA